MILVSFLQKRFGDFGRLSFQEDDEILDVLDSAVFAGVLYSK